MTQLRSHPRLVRKLQEALGDQLCIALEDASVVEIMLNPMENCSLNGSAKALLRPVRCRPPPQKW